MYLLGRDAARRTASYLVGEDEHVVESMLEDLKKEP
jgi:hypothetical protein